MELKDIIENAEAEKAARLAAKPLTEQLYTYLLDASSFSAQALETLDRIPQRDKPTTGPEITVSNETYVRVTIALCKIDAARKLVEEAEEEFWQAAESIFHAPADKAA